jgi:hypothetical protein
MPTHMTARPSCHALAARQDPQADAARSRASHVWPRVCSPAVLRTYGTANMFGGRCSLKCPTIVVTSQS